MGIIMGFSLNRSRGGESCRCGSGSGSSQSSDLTEGSRGWKAAAEAAAAGAGGREAEGGASWGGVRSPLCTL